MGGRVRRPRERRLLGGLFVEGPTVELSDLHRRFRPRLEAMRSALYLRVAGDGRWFSARPDEVRARFTLVALALAGLALPFACSRGSGSWRSRSR